MSVDFLKTIPQYLVPHKALNAFAGYIANLENIAIKNYIIKRFINKYQVNMTEALIEDPCVYTSFNDFFIRKLKPECRPMAQAEIICPVDGCVSEIGTIEAGQIIQAKGHDYSVQELLACDAQYAQQFIHGRFATLYLSPKDYHRVHMPIDAELISMTYIPGSLFSVSPTTARVVPKLFARNERLAVLFQTKLGLMAMVMVGAAIVGAIGTSWQGDIKRSKEKKRTDYTDKQYSQGDEMGYFKLGSTVVLLFANSEQVFWDEYLQAGSALRLGQSLVGTEKRT